MTLLVDVDLGGDGHAMQRPEFFATRTRGIRRVGGSQRLVVHAAYDGVQRRVHGVHPAKARLHGFARGGATGADQVSEFGSVKLPEFHRQYPIDRPVFFGPDLMSVYAALHFDRVVRGSAARSTRLRIRSASSSRQ